MLRTTWILVGLDLSLTQGALLRLGGRSLGSGKCVVDGARYFLTSFLSLRFYQLRIKMIIGLFFSNVGGTQFDPSSHLYTMGICQGSFMFCALSPGANTPVSAYGFLSYNAARISLATAAGYGLQQDAYLTATIYVDGNSATPGDYIFPVWQPTFSYLPAYGDSNTQDFVTSFMIEYEATRVG